MEGNTILALTYDFPYFLEVREPKDLKAFIVSIGLYDDKIEAKLDICGDTITVTAPTK